MVVTPVTLAPVSSALLAREPNITCLPAGSAEFTVPDLENAHDCEKSGRLRARRRLHALQDAVMEREEIAKKAAAAAPMP